MPNLPIDEMTFEELRFELEAYMELFDNVSETLAIADAKVREDEVTISSLTAEVDRLSRLLEEERAAHVRRVVEVSELFQKLDAKDVDPDSYAADAKLWTERTHETDKN